MITNIFKRTFSAKRVLITGAVGQVGRNFIPTLLKDIPAQNILATDLSSPQKVGSVFRGVPYRKMDAANKEEYRQVSTQFKPDIVVNMASILSARGERDPKRTWDINIAALFNSIQVSMELGATLFHASTIAVFGGENLKRDGTPDDHDKTPDTMYGCTKVASQVVGNYYKSKHGLDYRSLRYPAIISSEKFEAGGSLSYPQQLFFGVNFEGKTEYQIYLKPDTTGPIIHIQDVVEGTKKFIFTEREKLKQCSYNMNGYAASPRQFEYYLQKRRKQDGKAPVKIVYKPDPTRQRIIDSWTNYLDDSNAQRDWGWKLDRTFEQLCDELYEKSKNGYK